jgi:hypothetical protein
MMRAIPTASLRSLLLICIFKAALAVTLVDLHLQSRLGMPGIDADDGQSQLYSARSKAKSLLLPSRAQIC